MYFKYHKVDCWSHVTKLITIDHSLSSYGSISQNSLHLHLTVHRTFQAKLLPSNFQGQAWLHFMFSFQQLSSDGVG